MIWNHTLFRTHKQIEEYALSLIGQLLKNLTPYEMQAVCKDPVLLQSFINKVEDNKKLFFTSFRVVNDKIENIEDEIYDEMELA